MVANIHHVLEACEVKPGKKMIEIGDMTARLVLGDGNLDEWNRARLLSKRTILYWSVPFTFAVIDYALDANTLQPSQGLLYALRCGRFVSSSSWALSCGKFGTS
jgi:hypothetical protein